MSVSVPETGTLLGSLSPGWYAIKTDTGEIGVVLHHAIGNIHLGSGNGNVTSAVQITEGTGLSNLPALLGDANFGPITQDAIRSLGATAQQSTSLISQADTAAGKQQTSQGILGFLTLGILGSNPTGHQTTQLLLDKNGTPKASSGKLPVPTTPSGDVTTSPVSLPNVSVSGILGALGNLSFWKGLGLVLGGVIILVVAAIELKK